LNEDVIAFNPKDKTKKKLLPNRKRKKEEAGPNGRDFEVE
jgi:hypothetical protein